MRRYLPLLIILLSGGLVIAFDLHKFLTFQELKTHKEALLSFVNTHPWQAAGIYFVLYVLVVSLSIPGAAFMSITSGFLFGQWIGTAIVITSATLGAVILFLSARFATPEALTKNAGPWVKSMEQGFRENAFFYLLTLRLIPLFPFMAVNLVSAIVQMPLKTFVIGTFLGIIPGSFVFVSIGVALQETISTPSFTGQIVINPSVWIALSGLGVLSLLPVIYKKYKKPNS